LTRIFPRSIIWLRQLASLKKGEKVNKKHLLILVCIFVLGMLLIAACSPKERGRWNRNTDVNIGTVPDDVCIVDGKPLILNATTESDGGFNLVYIRNNGDIVVRAWLTDPIVGIVLKPAGQFYWTGGNCPSK
jgi:hypothetical protein